MPYTFIEVDSIQLKIISSSLAFWLTLPPLCHPHPSLASRFFRSADETSRVRQLIRVRSILRPKLAQKLEEEAKAAEAKENEGKASDNDGREAEENEEKEKEKEEEKKRKEEEEEKRKEEEEEKRLKMAEKEKEEALAERMLENVEHAYDPFYGRPWGTEVPKVTGAGRRTRGTLSGVEAACVLPPSVLSGKKTSELGCGGARKGMRGRGISCRRKAFSLRRMVCYE